MLELFVDADACPVKDEALRVAFRHDMPVHVVGNTWMRLGGAAGVNRVVVPDEPDAADDWIVEHVSANDIVVTADIRLAARCIEKGARALGPTGRPFTEDSIGMAVAMRDLTAHLRDTGEISGHNPGFTKQDRSRFLDALEQTVQAVKRDG